MLQANKYCTFFIIFFIFGKAVNAANIELNAFNPYQDDEPCSITLTGSITDGDAEIFDNIAPKAFGETWDGTSRYLCLDSPGGNFFEAIRIAELIRGYGFGTILNPNAECFSGCAFMFMAGSFSSSDFLLASRTMHATSKLGFHAPFLNLSLIPTDDLRPSDIVDSYQSALEATQKLIAMFVRPQYARYDFDRELWMKPSLIRVALAQSSDKFFFIDTIGKVGNFGINIHGIPKLKLSLEEMIINGCRNIYSWSIDTFGEWEIPITVFKDDHENPAYRPDAVPKPIQRENDSDQSQTHYAEIADGGSGGTKCIFQLKDQASQIDCGYLGDDIGKSVSISLADFNFENREWFCPKYWHLYDIHQRLPINE